MSAPHEPNYTFELSLANVYPNSMGVLVRLFENAGPMEMYIGSKRVDWRALEQSSAVAFAEDE